MPIEQPDDEPENDPPQHPRMHENERNADDHVEREDEGANNDEILQTLVGVYEVDKFPGQGANLLAGEERIVFGEDIPEGCLC